MELKQIEKISKALSDINRLKILQYMQRNQGKLQCNAIDSFLKLAQPSISHHIKKLMEDGLIESSKEGRFYNYSLNVDVWESYVDHLRKL